MMGKGKKTPDGASKRLVHERAENGAVGRKLRTSPAAKASLTSTVPLSSKKVGVDIFAVSELSTLSAWPWVQSQGVHSM